jgi:hypothetical protein
VVDALFMQLINIESGWIIAFAIGIPCAVWGYLSYLKQVGEEKKLP